MVGKHATAAQATADFAPKILKLLEKSTNADNAGDFERGHAAEDAALKLYVQHVAAGTYSAKQLQSIAEMLHTALTREDRGERWCV